MVRIVVADDHYVVRQGVRALLETLAYGAIAASNRAPSRAGGRMSSSWIW